MKPRIFYGNSHTESKVCVEIVCKEMEDFSGTGGALMDFSPASLFCADNSTYARKSRLFLLGGKIAARFGGD